MVAIRSSSGKKEELDAAPSWLLVALYAPLMVAAVTVVGLIVTLHLLYQRWLLDSHYRQYMLYFACLLTVGAFVVCCCIAFFIRRKQMLVDQYHVTLLTPLLTDKSLTPLYVDVEAPPAKVTKPAAG